MAPIQSRLWKAAQLALHSTYFPMMVRAAAWVANKPFSEGLLYTVATTQAIVNSVAVEPGKSIDESLLAVMETNGAALDSAIMSAVQAYTPPA